MSNTQLAVIFDNDGVLVDSEAFSEHAYQIALREQGLEVDPADAERYCGFTDADILRDMQQRYQRTFDFNRFSVRKRDLYFEAAGAGIMRVFPGARELLRELQAAQVPYALASSASREKIHFNLKQAGLAGEFPHIVSGEDFERGKPDPQIFLAAAQCIGVRPEVCVVIEDSINGLKAASAAGMAGVGVSNTFPSDRLMSHAARVVGSLTELSVAALRTLVAQQAQWQ